MTLNVTGNTFVQSIKILDMGLLPSVIVDVICHSVNTLVAGIEVVYVN